MRKNLFAALFLSLIPLAVDAAPVFKSGNDLKTLLENTGNYGHGLGYVVGVADSISILNYVCFPSGEAGVRAGQLGDIVLKYLRENPEILHRDAADLVFVALSRVWPCKSGSEPPPSPSPRTPKPPKPKPTTKEEASPF